MTAYKELLNVITVDEEENMQKIIRGISSIVVHVGDLSNFRVVITRNNYK